MVSSYLLLSPTTNVHAPEQGVYESWLYVSSWNSVLDGTDQDGSERQYDKRDEDTLDRVFDETKGLLGVHWSAAHESHDYSTRTRRRRTYE